MGTRSRIGIELKNGSVLSVYHHWSGYPEWLGRILNTHYNTRQKVAELIDGGDMSICWTDVRWDDSADGSYGPQYYSQRGEDCPPRLDADLNEYLCNSEEYSYIFNKQGEWVCYANDYRIPGNVNEIPIPSGALAV